MSNCKDIKEQFHISQWYPKLLSECWNIIVLCTGTLKFIVCMKNRHTESRYWSNGKSVHAWLFIDHNQIHFKLWIKVSTWVNVWISKASIPRQYHSAMMTMHFQPMTLCAMRLQAASSQVVKSIFLTHMMHITVELTASIQGARN